MLIQITHRPYWYYFLKFKNISRNKVAPTGPVKTLMTYSATETTLGGEKLLDLSKKIELTHQLYPEAGNR